jgi:diguanylate cyclase (GGDEF)-like protein
MREDGARAPSHLAGPRPKTGARIRSAAIWKTPRSSLVLILSVEALCVTWLALANAYGTPDMSDVGRFILLSALALVYAEANGRIERVRRFMGGAGNSILAGASSLWCFTAVLILPAGLAGGIAVIIYIEALLRNHRHRLVVPHRLVYSGAADLAAVLAAASVLSQLGGLGMVDGNSASSLLGVLAAMLTYAVVNQALVVSAVYLVRRPIPLRAVLGGLDEQLTEFATLALAVLFAVTIVHAPILSPFTLVLISVLQRSALVRQLQEQATRDAKTGLLNSGAWRQEAERELVRGERVGTPMSVLMIDLDHFKQLNDQYGHPAGDAVLRSVADCIGEALRGYDAVGRFGGEEFIALLADAGEQVSARVAERLRARIAALEFGHDGQVTASIGVGVGIAAVHSLDEMILIADKALYIAKRSGRNKVHLSHVAASSAVTERHTTS